tara:strand:- start:1050 stop:1265 length:216 start_codon:yes stop_codon:yes gene_type:complete
MLKNKSPRKIKFLYGMLCFVLVLSAVFSFMYASHLESELGKIEEQIKVLEEKKQESLRDKLDKMIENMEKN